MSRLELQFTLTPIIDTGKLNVYINALKNSLGDLGKDIKLIDDKEIQSALSKLEAEAQKNLGGIGEKISDIDGKTEKLGKTVGNTGGIFQKAFAFNQIAQSAQLIGDTFDQITSAGVQYESSLAAVGAITGFTGENLDKLGNSARGLAKEFGGSATDQLSSFQGILSKLGPAVAEDSAALELFGKNVNILSKASGDDAATSMNAITDAMLQMGLATGTPMEQAQKSTDVINALAASAQVGAAEIPQVAEALVQVGVAAKGAGLDLVDSNAAIQVMAVGGKTGSEAGIALRNVLGLMQKNSEEANKTMMKMGFSLKELGAALNEEGLPSALEMINKGMGNFSTQAEKNAALMQIFGAENAAAAGILLQNTDKFAEFSDGIKAGMEGTGSAFEQAGMRMNTSQGAMDRMKAAVDDVLISFQQAFGGKTLTMITGLGTQIAPLVISMGALGSLIPTKAIGQFALSIISSLVPSLVTQATATTAATFSWSAFWAAATGPIGLAILGIAAVTAATIGLVSWIHKSTEEKLDEAEADEKAIKKQQELNLSKQKQAESNINLVKTYEELGNKQNKTVGEVEKFNQVQEKLAKTYPGTIHSTKSFAENLKSIKDETGLQNAELGKLTDQNKKLVAEYEKLGSKQERTKEENKRYNEVISELNKTYPNVISGTNSFSENLEGLKSRVGLTSGEMRKLQNEMENLSKKAQEALAVKLRLQLQKAVDDAKEVGDDFAKFSLVGFTVKDADAKAVKDYVENVKNKLNGLKEVNNVEKYISNVSANIWSDFKNTLSQEGIAELEKKLKEMGDLKIKLIEQYNIRTGKAAGAAEQTKNDTLNLGDNLDALNNNTNATAANAEAKEKLTKKYDDLKKQHQEEIRLFEQETELNAKKEGRKVTDEESLKNLDLRRAKLDEEKKIVDELSSRYKITFDELTKEVKIGVKLDDEKTQDLTSMFYDYLNRDVELEIKKININPTGDDLSAKLKELNQSKKDLLKLNLELGLSPATEVFKKIRIILNDELTVLANDQESIQKRITEGSGKLTESQLKALETDLEKAKIAILNKRKEINENTRQIADAFEDEQLSQITNAAQYEYAVRVKEAKRAYQENLDAANGNIALEKEAFIAFQFEKLKIEQDYLDRSSGIVSNTLRSASAAWILAVQDAFSMPQDERAVADAKDRLKAIDKEESDLRKSYASRLIDREDFNDKMKELDEQRKDAATNLADAEITTLERLSAAASIFFGEMSAKMAAFQASQMESYDTKNKVIVKLEKDSFNFEQDMWKAYEEGELEKASALYEQYVQASDSKLKLVEEAADIEKSIYASVAIQAGANFAKMIADGKSFAKASVLTSLGALKALVPVLLVEILGKEIASKSFAGIATGAGLGALIITALSAAESKVASMNFFKGGLSPNLTGAGGGYQAGGQMTRVTWNELGPEFIVNHATTAKNLTDLEAINARRDITIDQYVFEKHKLAERFAGYDKQIAVLAKAFKNIADPLLKQSHKMNQYMNDMADMHVKNNEAKKNEPVRRTVVNSRTPLNINLNKKVLTSAVIEEKCEMLGRL